MGCQRRRSVFIDFTTRTHPHPPPRLLFFICRYLLFDFSDSKPILSSLYLSNAIGWDFFLSHQSYIPQPGAGICFAFDPIVLAHYLRLPAVHRNWPISIQLFFHTNSGYQFPSSATSRLQLLQIDIESYYYYPPRGNGQIYPLETILQLLGDTLVWDTTTTITSKLLGVNL